MSWQFMSIACVFMSMMEFIAAALCFILALVYVGKMEIFPAIVFGLLCFILCFLANKTLQKGKER